MPESTYRIDLALENYKSYYSGVTKLTLRKPITVLAGPNGEGKSNLLEGLLIPSADFLANSRKFANTSLFRRHVQISSEHGVEASFHDLIFQDHLY